MHWQAAENVKGSTGRLLMVARSPEARVLAVADYAEVWRRLALLALGMQVAIWRVRGTGELAVGTQGTLWGTVASRLSAAIAASGAASEHVADTRAILRQHLGRDERRVPADRSAPDPGGLLAAVSRAVDDVHRFNSSADGEGSADQPGYYVTLGWIGDGLRDLAAFCSVGGDTVPGAYSGFGAARRGAVMRRAMQGTGREWLRAAIGLDDAVWALGDKWFGFGGSGAGCES